MQGFPDMLFLSTFELHTSLISKAAGEECPSTNPSGEIRTKSSYSICRNRIQGMIQYALSAYTPTYGTK